MKNFSYNKIGMIFTLAIAFVILPTITSAASLYRQLQLGMRGSDVSALQAFLALDNTIYPQGLVTGYFGSLTKSAVSNFQARNGISTVGRVGPQTMAAINAQMNNSGVTSLDGKMRVIEPVSLSTSNTQATLSWNTGEGSVSSIYYGTSPLTLTEATEYSPFMISGGYNMIVSSDLRTSHTGTLTGLNSNTTYYYVIYVKDAQGNESITMPSTFRTN